MEASDITSPHMIYLDRCLLEICKTANNVGKR